MFPIIPRYIVCYNLPMNQKKRKKRKLRTWVKVVLALLGITIAWSVLRPLLSKEEHEANRNDPDQTAYKVDTNAVVLIDPGHGGMDGGAISTSNKAEKQYSLEYALKIGEYIQQYNPNIEVIYTHNSDEIPWENVNSYNYALDDLNGRTNLIYEKDPDYVLSVHFNSQEDNSEYGYESYVRKDDVASDTIYSYIVKNLEAIPWSKNNGGWSTEGYPLQIVDMVKSPSMLIELGYLTNANEVNELNTEATKDKICKAIAKAYCQYIADNPGPTERQDLAKNPNVIAENLPEEERKKVEEARAKEKAEQEAAQAAANSSSAEQVPNTN